MNDLFYEERLASERAVASCYHEYLIEDADTPVRTVWATSPADAIRSVRAYHNVTNANIVATEVK